MSRNGGTKTAIFSLKPVDAKMEAGEKIRALGGNTGNLVFDTALPALIDGDQVYWDTPEPILEQYDRFVTTSYIWIRKNQEISSSLHLVGDKPMIPMSVGLQSNDYDPHFQIHPAAVNELKKMEERCVIGCRGEYTAEILNRHGIRRTMVIGCPSVYLGIRSAVMVKYFSGYHPQSVTSNFASFWRKLKDFEADFLTFAAKNKFGFIEQTEGKMKREYWPKEESEYQQAAQWLNRGKIFFSYETWKEEIQNYDFSLGYRFHGNVMAVINGIPALFIYSDSRVREMCEFFKLPMISAREFDADKPVEYWYEKSDYSDYNKLIDKKRKIFKEFCDKNNLMIREETGNKGTDGQED